jgi:hypothetical protein
MSTLHPPTPDDQDQELPARPDADPSPVEHLASAERELASRRREVRSLRRRIHRQHRRKWLAWICSISSRVLTVVGGLAFLAATVFLIAGDGTAARDFFALAAAAWGGATAVHRRRR